MTNAKAWDYAIGIIKVDGLEPTGSRREPTEDPNKRTYPGGK